MSSEGEGAAQQVQPTAPARVAGPAITFKLQAADHDARRAYNYTEATALMDRYRHLVLQQCGKADSWFSLYELKKVGPAKQVIAFDPTRNSFGDLEDTVAKIESMWKACGYDFRRRERFADAVGLDPARTAQDVGLMASLLIAENEWESSIVAYRENKPQGEAKYLVMADPVYTPQTKSAPKMMKQLVEGPMELDEDNVWAKSIRVKKKLDFSAVESDDDMPVKTRTAQDPLISKFMAMMSSGNLSMEDLARVSTALASKSSGDEMYESRSGWNAPTQKPAKKSQRMPRGEVDWEYEVEMTANDETTWNYPNRPVTVLQNLAIRSFDGAKSSPEEARAWLSKFLHIANLSGWNARQRLEMFIDSLTNPAKYWVRQLPTEVKSDWSQLLPTFKRKYCTDVVPPRLQYYKLTQKSDELGSNYLYRLNGAALRAGINFRDESDPELLDDHIQQFFDTLHDKTLQMQFRFTAFDSIDELERKLLQYESTQLRPVKKTTTKKANEDGSSDVMPAVNRVNQDYRGGGGGGGSGGGYSRPPSNEEYKPARPSNQGNSAGQGRPEQQNKRLECEHCGKTGHTIDACWQLLVCQYCEQRGHPIKYCRAFIEEMAKKHIESKAEESKVTESSNN